MSIEDLESFQSLQGMCSWSNRPPQECPMDLDDHTTPVTQSVPVPAPDNHAQVFDLNDLLYCALLIEDQLNYNQAEFLG